MRSMPCWRAARFAQRADPIRQGALDSDPHRRYHYAQRGDLLLFVSEHQGFLPTRDRSMRSIAERSSDDGCADPHRRDRSALITDSLCS